MILLRHVFNTPRQARSAATKEHSTAVMVQLPCGKFWYSILADRSDARYIPAMENGSIIRPVESWMRGTIAKA